MSQHDTFDLDDLSWSPKVRSNNLCIHRDRGWSGTPGNVLPGKGAAITVEGGFRLSITVPIFYKPVQTYDEIKAGIDKAIKASISIINSGDRT